MGFLNLKTGVYTFFGVPGSGKTTVAASIVKEALKKKVPVYSNVPIKGAYIVDRADIGKYNFPYPEGGRSVLILDEIGITYNNRNFKTNFDKEGLALSWWKLHRHYHCLIFIFSQTYDDMDKILRNLTQQYYLVQPSLIPNFIRCLPIRFKIGINELSGDIQDMYSFDPALKSLFTTRRIWARPCWKYFDSWDAPPLPDLPELKSYGEV